MAKLNIQSQLDKVAKLNADKIKAVKIGTVFTINDSNNLSISLIEGLDEFTLSNEVFINLNMLKTPVLTKKGTYIVGNLYVKEKKAKGSAFDQQADD